MKKSMFVAAMFAGALSTAAMAQQPQTAQPGTTAAPTTQQPGTTGAPTTQQPAPGGQASGSAPMNQSASDRQTTLQGCLQKNKSGGFWLTKAMPASMSASSNGSPTSATGSTSTQPGTAGTSGTTAPRPSDSAASMPRTGAAMTYNLEEMDGKVGSMDLDKHVGHKVEVVGRVDDTKSSDKLKTGAGATAANQGGEMDAQDFHIASIRMLDGNCN